MLGTGTKPNKSQKSLRFLFFILYFSLTTVIPLDSFFFSLTQEQPTTSICSLPVVHIAILSNQSKGSNEVNRHYFIYFFILLSYTFSVLPSLPLHSLSTLSHDLHAPNLLRRNCLVLFPM